MHILLDIKRKDLISLIRKTRGDAQSQLLWYAVNANFVLGAMYLYYVKGLRCEGLEAQSRLMSWVLWLPYKGPEPLKYDFQKGIDSWQGWVSIPGYLECNKAISCTIDGVPYVLIILGCRCDATYNLFKYCLTTGEHKLIPGFNSIEECQEYVCKTYSGETGRCEIAHAN